MSKPVKRWLLQSRARVLEDAEALSHALLCPSCELRWEATVVLAVVGWTPDEFFAAAEQEALREAGDA